MKYIPIIFPIALAVIIIGIFFIGAYAIAEGATYYDVVVSGNRFTDDPVSLRADRDWYQAAAILVCPLH